MKHTSGQQLVKTLTVFSSLHIEDQNNRAGYKLKSLQLVQNREEYMMDQVGFLPSREISTTDQTGQEEHNELFLK